MTRRVWGTAATVLLAPIACTAVLAAALFMMNALVWAPWWHSMPVDMMLLQTPLVTLFSICGAAGLALLARRLGRLTALTTAARVVPAVLLVGLPALLAASAKSYNTGSLVLGVLVWWCGLVVALAVVATLAGRGRSRAAWVAGTVGGLVAADLAFIAALLKKAGDGQLDGAYAPMWLLFGLTDWDFGLHPDLAADVMPVTFVIGDMLGAYAPFYLICTGYAVGYVIGAMRPLPARSAEPVTAQPA